jgi:hypothetical protein
MYDHMRSFADELRSALAGNTPKHEHAPKTQIASDEGELGDITESREVRTLYTLAEDYRRKISSIKDPRNLALRASRDDRELRKIELKVEILERRRTAVLCILSLLISEEFENYPASRWHLGLRKGWKVVVKLNGEKPTCCPRLHD